ncbi:MAG: thioredoxin [Agathobacter sp.]|nr:thioredoxin [Agathobacter sp.]
MYLSDPSASLYETIAYYEEYVKEAREEGKKPVSFLRYITGRY